MYRMRSWLRHLTLTRWFFIFNVYLTTVGVGDGSQEENVNKKRATEASLAKLRALEKSTQKTARLKNLAQVGLL